VEIACKEDVVDKIQDTVDFLKFLRGLEYMMYEIGADDLLVYHTGSNSCPVNYNWRKLYSRIKTCKRKLREYLGRKHSAKLLKELAEFKPKLPIGFYLADAKRKRYGDSGIY
jgi:hypothetical protein